MTTALRSGEVAAAAGVNLQTLRYYERRGLLAEPARTSGGHRAYPPDAVTVVRVIKAAQRLGFTLDEVAGLLDAGRHRHGTAPDAGLRRQAEVKLAEIDARIADLQTIRQTLAAAVAAGCDDLAACAASPDCPLPFVELAGEPLEGERWAGECEPSGREPDGYEPGGCEPGEP
jgi:MerR family mercuric resistance operon transcriptional regulator